MNSLVTDLRSGDCPDCFLSFSALQTAYTELLKRHREDEGNLELLSEISDFIVRGQKTGIFIDNDNDRLTAQSFLNYWVSVLLREKYPVPAFDLAEFDITLAPELNESDCPYLGLEAFQEEDANLFYGRQRLVTQLIDTLASNDFLAIVGPSGSGKSSVVRGGLIPKLKVGALPHSDQWHYFSPMVPGSTPLENLVKTLAPNSGADADWVQQQIHRLETGLVSLPALIRQRGGDQPTVVVIDQFEEVFTLCSETTRDSFVKHLVALVQATEAPPNYLILTMRSDFEEQATKLDQLWPLFKANLVRVLPLDAGELREAIETPAQQVGLKFEAGVVDKLITDVLGEPAALPLLQFMLLQLWEHRERNRVTYAAYRQLGGGRGALAHSADEFYTNLIPEDQETAKRILLKMVRPSSGLEFTNNRIRQQELYQLGIDPGRINRVLEKLFSARLVRKTRGETLDDTQIEVAHEALIRNWPRLIEWLDYERVNLRQRLRLADSAIEWQRRGYPKNLLLRGNLITEAQQYNDLTELETRFVRQSSLRERNKKRIWSLGGGIVIIALLASNIYAFQKSEIAKKQSRLAISASQKAISASQQAEKERDKAILALKLSEQLRKEEQQSREMVDRKLTNIQNSLPPDATAAKEQIVNAQNELRRVENLVRIEYFKKQGDSPKIEDTLSRIKGNKFDVITINATVVQNQPTNAIWFGKNVPVEDVKKLAGELIGAGINIDSIIFKDKWPDIQSRLIQLGGNYVGNCDRAWTVKDIEQITNINQFPTSNVSMGCPP